MRFDGAPAPIAFGDMNAAARMVRGEIDAVTLVRIFAALDRDAFEHGARVDAHNNRNNR